MVVKTQSVQRRSDRVKFYFGSNNQDLKQERLPSIQTEGAIILSKSGDI